MKLPCVIVVLCAVASMQGCKGSTDAGGGLAPRYALYTIDQQSLPWRISSSLDGSVYEVVGGELVVKSRGVLLDIVTYQRTAGNGTKETPIADTVSLPFVVVGSELRVTRRRADGSTFEQSLAIDGEYLSGERTFKTVIGTETGLAATGYQQAP